MNHAHHLQYQTLPISCAPHGKLRRLSCPVLPLGSRAVHLVLVGNPRLNCARWRSNMTWRGGREMIYKRHLELSARLGATSPGLRSISINLHIISNRAHFLSYSRPPSDEFAN